jgi:predicted component of type VI protein secretion system
MKFIPGEFEVITGDDKGRIIKIGGYPTEDGSIVTIGREEVTGQRDFAHIQLKEKTISRRQAEIILKDGKMYIKNLSQTNYTKLDGKEIPPNTSSELNSGSVITFGEVEMKYNIK